MLGFFKKKAPARSIGEVELEKLLTLLHSSILNARSSNAVHVMSSAGAEIIQIQLVIRNIELGRVLDSVKSKGYMFGVHDALAQYLGVTKPIEGIAAISTSYMSIFGEQTAARLVKESLDLQGNNDFMQGRAQGGQEVMDYIRSTSRVKMSPMGLVKTLL
jgi:hypothetical protein